MNVDFQVPYHCPQLAPVQIPRWSYNGVPQLVTLPNGMSSADAQALKESLAVLEIATVPTDIQRYVRQIALSWE
ncbi:hypothetical protein SERLA73DRAFT_178871, partial [Serpula lacrymans var. lacrymans S7.3]